MFFVPGTSVGRFLGLLCVWFAAYGLVFSLQFTPKLRSLGHEFLTLAGFLMLLLTILLHQLPRHNVHGVNHEYWSH